MVAQTAWKKLRKLMARARLRARRYLPPGLRLIAGLLLIVGGVFGFLPVLGFWMIPLGISIAALDVRPLWRLLRQRTHR